MTTIIRLGNVVEGSRAYYCLLAAFGDSGGDWRPVHRLTACEA